MVKQSAFVFAKPHANTEKVQAEIAKKFGDVGITIIKEGKIGGKAIDDEKFIDTHYYAIASKATLMTPDELNIPEEKFKDTFGEEWKTVLAEKRALNALDIKKQFGWTADELDGYWDKTSDKLSPKTRVKFGGGFYCGQIEVDGKKYYTFNAFFMTMRGKFTNADESIHYYVVEFDSDTLKWGDFRGKVLGPTDPAAAPADSLRGIVMADWKNLGLKSEPNTGDNAVHASASPFEGLAERTNWLKSDFTVETDAFSKLLLEAGLSKETLTAWSVDPQVKVDADGKKGSLFDQVEDMDSAECIAKLKELNELNK